MLQRNICKGEKGKASLTNSCSPMPEVLISSPHNILVPESLSTILLVYLSIPSVMKTSEPKLEGASSVSLVLDQYFLEKSEDLRWTVEIFNIFDDQDIGKPKLSRKKSRGWKDGLTDSFNLISNINWDFTFWKAINTSSIIHTLGITELDDSKGVTSFLI